MSQDPIRQPLAWYVRLWNGRLVPGSSQIVSRRTGLVRTELHRSDAGGTIGGMKSFVHRAGSAGCVLCLAMIPVAVIAQAKNWKGLPDRAPLWALMGFWAFVLLRFLTRPAVTVNGMASPSTSGSKRCGPLSWLAGLSARFWIDAALVVALGYVVGFWLFLYTPDGSNRDISETLYWPLITFARAVIFWLT